MKWFDNWFANKCRRALEIDHNLQEEDDYDGTSPSPYVSLSKNINIIKKRRGLVTTSGDMDLPEGGLNIQVKNAIGGKIVIFRSYDDRTDRNCYSTYLIPDTEVFQESLGKIITMESLKL
jgi:hypothetical protein